MPALSQAKVPGVKSFWPGKIDGRPSADLEDAITLFQHSQRIAITGRIGRTCPTCVRLESVLPAAFKGLNSKANAAANSNVKPKPNINGQTLGAGRRPVKVPTRPNAPLPRDQLLKKLALSMNLKNDLTAYRGAAYRELGLVVSYVEMTTDVSGVLRFELDMTPEPSQLETRQLRLLAGRFPSFNALSDTPLILGTTRPIRFRQGTLRPGAAGHKIFAGTINKNGGAVHDAAALQAALINIARPDGPKFWTGAVDGNGTVKLSAALADFQVAADIQPTGSVGPGTPTEQALIAALPDGLKRITGVKGLPVAFVSGANSPPLASVGDAPQAFRDALDAARAAVKHATGLAIVALKPPTIVPGGTAVDIHLGFGQFLDSQARPITTGQLPKEIRATVERALKDIPNLDLDPTLSRPKLLYLDLPADFQPIHFDTRDAMLVVIELDTALDEKFGLGLAGTAGTGEAAVKYAEALGFDSVDDAKLIENGGLRALLLEIRRGTNLPSLLKDFLSEPPKVIAVKVVEAAGKAVKGSALEITVIGSLEIMKVVTETAEWEESVGNFVSGTARVVVGSAIAAAGVALFGVIAPVVVATGAGVILVFAVVGLVAGRGLEIADDGRLAKYIADGIRSFQKRNIELQGTPRDINEFGDQQFWDTFDNAKSY